MVRFWDIGREPQACQEDLKLLGVKNPRAAIDKAQKPIFLHTARAST